METQTDIKLLAEEIEALRVENQFLKSQLENYCSKPTSTVSNNNPEEFDSSTIDALSTHIAILDETGTILAVNRAWIEFAKSNPPYNENAFSGVNYLEVCKSASGKFSDEAPDVAKGLKAVLKGDLKEFVLDYPCHSLEEKRWFNLKVTRYYRNNSIRLVVAHENITKLKQAEIVIKQQTATYSAVLEFSTSSIFSLDKEYCYTSFNDAHFQIMKKIYGASIEVGHSIFEYQTVEKDAKTAQNNLDRVLKGESFIESAYSGAEGISRRFFDITHSPIKNSTGEITGISVYSRDVTERKEAEIAREEAHNRLNKIAQSVPGFLYQILLRPDGRLCMPFASEGIREMFRVSPEDVLEDATKTVQAIHPDDTENVLRSIMESAANLTPWNQEFRTKFEDGTIEWLLGKSLPEKLPDGSIIWHGFMTNFTERKNIEQAFRKNQELLHETNEYLENLFNYANAPIIVWDNDLVITRFNHAFEQLSGYEASYVIGRKIDILFPLKKIIYSLEQIRKTITGEKWETVEIEILRKDNEIRTVLWNSANVLDRNGKEIIATIAQGQDITERKQAEQALHESNEYLENLFNYANAPIIVWDNELNITRFNRAFEQLSGFAASEVINWKIDILFPTEKIYSSLEQIKKAAFGEKWETVEIEILRKDGKIRTVLWNSANVLDKNGKEIIATIAQGQDITERKQAEQALHESNEYLENLFNYANAPIIVWDNELNITRFNRAFEELSGYNVSEVIYKKIDILFPVDTIGYSLEQINKAISGQKWETVEIEILKKDAEIRTVLWNSANILDKTGTEIIATIAQGQDITGRKKAEHEIKLKNQQLLKMNAEKDKFFSIIAHDLKSPFQGFLGYTELIADNIKVFKEDELTRIAKKMNKSAQNLFKLLENLLEWARIQRGSVGFNPSELFLSELVDQNIMTIEPRASQKGISIFCDIPADIKFFGDEKATNVVLRNLLSNAVKFTRKDGEVNIRSKVVPNKMIQITVSDTGVGMPADLLLCLFNVSEKIGSKGTDGELSTGLGLLLCKEYVEIQGGTIWAESTNGKGSSFHFTLPLIE